MNTLTWAPVLKQTRSRDYEFVLDDLELAFPKYQLEKITEEWNNGKQVEEIAKNNRRDADEVFLALFHQARKKKIKRPFAYRKR